MQFEALNATYNKPDISRQNYQETDAEEHQQRPDNTLKEKYPETAYLKAKMRFNPRCAIAPVNIGHNNTDHMRDRKDKARQIDKVDELSHLHCALHPGLILSLACDIIHPDAFSNLFQTFQRFLQQEINFPDVRRNESV